MCVNMLNEIYHQVEYLPETNRTIDFDSYLVFYKKELQKDKGEMGFTFHEVVGMVKMKFGNITYTPCSIYETLLN